MKNTLKEIVMLILSQDAKGLSKIAAIVTTIVAIASVLLIMWGCSAQYAHCMKYTDGDKTVTIECQTQTNAERR